MAIYIFGLPGGALRQTGGDLEVVDGAAGHDFIGQRGGEFSLDQRRRRVIRFDSALPNPNAGDMIANLADCRHLDFVILT